MARTTDIGAAVAEPDVEAVLHDLRATRAGVAGDLGALQDEAAAHEAFGAAEIEGIQSVSAEAAELWLAAGQLDRAALLVTQLLAGGLGGIARDVDFLLT